MTIRTYALLFGVALLHAFAFAQQGPVITPQVNTDYYVGEVSQGYYPTIQSAVSDTCTNAPLGARVVIPRGATPPDTIAGAHGCTAVIVVDLRSLPDACYAWGTSYTSTPCASGSGGSSTSATETPAGVINGTNTSFTLSHSPTLLLLNLNGLLLTPGTDYTDAGTAITMSTIPHTGDKLYAQYFYGSGTGTAFQQTPTGMMNGTNTAFTLTHTPLILFLSRNGVQLDAGTDYTLSGTSLTMTAAPISEDTFNAQYFY